MTLHPFRKKVRTFRSSRQPVAHNKRIAPHRFCVNLAQLPKCRARICAILISGFPVDVRLRNRLREVRGQTRCFSALSNCRPGAGHACSPGTACRRCAAYSPPTTETCALCFCRCLIRKVIRKVRFGQSFAGGAMLAPPAQSAGMFGRHCPAPSDGPMSRRKSQGLPRDSRSLR